MEVLVDIRATRRREALAALVFLVALALTCLAYAPGLTGSLHFDDEPNLAGLAHVDGLPSAIRFITEGVAGPLGRPLALASFVPQAYAWPDLPSAFLYINICIHLLNGVLVVWFIYCLTRARDATSQAGWFAVMTGFVWMVLPILVSSSLLIVQRMTTLSATFTLFGLIGYLYCRRLLEEKPRLSLALMTLALALGSLLAALAKENGALLPLLVLVIELTVLSAPSNVRSKLWWRLWQALVLVTPSVALVGYLAAQGPYSESVVLARGFSLADRLLTQAHVLWEYLYRAYVPDTSALGPFHDDYPVQRDWFSLSSILSVGGWLGVICGAIFLRRRAPLFAFAVAWYIAGHALESTTVPLELYFEHRNYIPLIGPTFAAVAALASSSLPSRLTNACLLMYALVLTIVLFNTTSLWGRPALAAEIWHIRHPDSARAVQYLGAELNRSGDLRAVHRLFNEFADKHPESSAVALQALVFACIVEPTESHEREIESIRTNLPLARFEYAVFDALRELSRLAASGNCESIDRPTVYDLTNEFASHPVFRGVPVMRHNLHLLMSEEAFAQRDLNLTMHHIESALAARYTISSLVAAVGTLASAGLVPEAWRFVDEARNRVPSHPLRAMRWKQQVEAIEKALQELEHD